MEVLLYIMLQNGVWNRLLNCFSLVEVSDFVVLLIQFLVSIPPPVKFGLFS